MAKLKTTAAEMVANARAEIREIETPDLIAMLDDPNVVVVDIRDVRERQRGGFIPGSVHAPRGMLEFWIDPDSPYFKTIFGEDKQFVFHCASGWRSALAVNTLNQMGFDAAHLREGFSTWEAQGGPVEKAT
ncbi:rhodanese-like domain-containing protein [Planktotalea arctica]|uniref:rhodanese-like domain-containing protein n=1 Tax=Planktotalea arctica TaxID=1481893 RepID=UPI000A1771BC|nr:rhodanese-like domain-containing protein [Planktotalea arctica]